MTAHDDRAPQCARDAPEQQPADDDAQRDERGGAEGGDGDADEEVRSAPYGGEGDEEQQIDRRHGDSRRGYPGTPTS
jgi:hypothetical protein